MLSVAAGVADEERGMLDSLVDDKATAGAQEPPDDVHKERALGTDGGTEWRCQLASLRQATRLAGECPDPQQIGRESLDVEEWGREAGAATERRRRWGWYHVIIIRIRGGWTTRWGLEMLIAAGA